MPKKKTITASTAKIAISDHDLIRLIIAIVLKDIFSLNFTSMSSPLRIYVPKRKLLELCL